MKDLFTKITSQMSDAQEMGAHDPRCWSLVYDLDDDDPFLFRRYEKCTLPEAILICQAKAFTARSIHGSIHDNTIENDIEVPTTEQNLFFYQVRFALEEWENNPMKGACLMCTRGDSHSRRVCETNRTRA